MASFIPSQRFNPSGGRFYFLPRFTSLFPERRQGLFSNIRRLRRKLNQPEVAQCLSPQMLFTLHAKSHVLVKLVFLLGSQLLLGCTHSHTFTSVCQYKMHVRVLLAADIHNLTGQMFFNANPRIFSGVLKLARVGNTNFTFFCAVGY